MPLMVTEVVTALEESSSLTRGLHPTHGGGRHLVLDASSFLVGLGLAGTRVRTRVASAAVPRRVALRT